MNVCDVSGYYLHFFLASQSQPTNFACDLAMYNNHRVKWVGPETHTSSLITRVHVQVQPGVASEWYLESSRVLLHTSPLVGGTSPEGLFQDRQGSRH